MGLLGTALAACAGRMRGCSIVAEIEVGGWRAEGLAEPADVVVCAPNAPAPLALALRPPDDLAAVDSHIYIYL